MATRPGQAVPSHSTYSRGQHGSARAILDTRARSIATAFDAEFRFLRTLLYAMMEHRPPYGARYCQLNPRASVFQRGLLARPLRATAFKHVAEIVLTVSAEQPSPRAGTAVKRGATGGAPVPRMALGATVTRVGVNRGALRPALAPGEPSGVCSAVQHKEFTLYGVNVSCPVSRRAKPASRSAARSMSVSEIVSTPLCI